MKAKLLAVAIAAALPMVASAQSNVTMFGVVDTNIGSEKAGSNKATGMGKSGYQTNRFGVRGSEDLGGGLKANFWLESDITSNGGSNGAAGAGQNNGAVTAAANFSQFSRLAYVGLSGGWGAVNFGRQYTPHFTVHTTYDNFGTTGPVSVANITLGASTVVGTALNSSSGVRASNAIRYDSPNWSGFNFAAMYNYGEVVNNSGRERATGFNIGYAPGNWGIHLGYNNQKDQGGVVGYRTRDTILGAQYTFGFGLKISGMWHSRSSSGDPLIVGGSGRARDWNLGLTYTTGAHNIRGAYTRRNTNLLNDSGDANQYGLMYDYSLSKRTVAYVSYARIRNRGTAATGSAYITNGTNEALATYGGAGGQRSSGFVFGVRHAF
jgi:predicted porin